MKMSIDHKKFLEGGLLKDRYLRVEGINEGSFGVVSLAKDTQKDDMLVALKYNTSSSDDFEAFEKADGKSTYANAQIEHPKLDKKFILRETQEEVRMLKKVGRHPNITCLIDSFDTYIVMEYVARGDLHDAIQLGIAPVSTRDVVDVFMQLVNAVEHCHKMGVYHRDIKPENILIAEDWSIKLTDFGLATDRLWCKDFDVGSERYMAPELLDHDDSDKYRADKVDLWSMGICLLNIVFGKSPFRAADSNDKLFLYFAANRETLFDIFPTMSYDLFGVLRHSLTIDPENRSLEQMKDALRKIEVLTYDYEFEEEEEAEEEAKMKETTKMFEEKAIHGEPFIPLELPDEHPKMNEKGTALGEFIPKSAPEHSLLTSRLKNLNSSLEKPDRVLKRGGLIVGKKIPDTIPEVEATKEYEKKSSKKNIYVVPKGRFPHYRKPINIPTGIKHRDRSNDGRIIKKPMENEFEKQSPFAREDFFTPHSVFDHYMLKTNQHRKFDHRARAYNRNYHNNTLENSHRNRAWRQRRNNRTQYSDRYRNGYRAQAKRKNFVPPRCSFRNKKTDSDKSANPRSIPTIHQYTTAQLCHSTNKTSMMNFSSPSGKYIPPNMRYRPPSPQFSPAGPHKELQPEEFAVDDDDLFMFEESGAGKNNNSSDLNHSRPEGAFENPEMDKLSDKFSDQCIIEPSSETDDHRFSPVLHKYVPPHQRKSFHTQTQYNFTKSESFGHKQRTHSLSSSAPIRKPCFSFGRYRPRMGLDDTTKHHSRPISFFSGKKEADKMVSDDFGLSYIDMDEDDEVKRRQLNGNTRVR